MAPGTDLPKFDNLEGLSDWADRSLDVCFVAHDYGDEILLGEFWRAEPSEKGSGATVLRALCDYADRLRKPVVLAVLMGNEILVDYYGRFGFQIDESGDEPGDDIGMKRMPGAIVLSDRWSLGSHCSGIWG
jgi:hypothetical protein